MRQHPLDRQMGLAGVGRPKHCGDARAGSPFVGERCLRRESHIFLEFLQSFGAAVGCACGALDLILCHNATLARSRLKLWNESRTNRARIADSTPRPASFTATSRVDAFSTALDQVWRGSTSGGWRANFLRFWQARSRIRSEKESSRDRGNSLGFCDPPWHSL